MRKAALAFLVVCAAALVWQPASALSLGGIRNSLVQWVLDKVSVEGVFEITVEEVIGEEEEGTALIGVAIADAEGVWFTADRLTFDFNKTRLLRGQLFIETLALSGVEVLRQPVIPAGEEIEVNLEGVEAPPEPDTPFYWPRSPVTTAIQSMTLTDVYLHEGVLGQALRFDASGSFRDQDDVQEAALEVRRTDAVEGVIDFDYNRNFDADTLALNLDASEAPGGIVSELSGLPPDVPVRLAVKADGTPDDFGTTFDLALTDYLAAQGTATLDYAGPLGIDATFTARPGPRMPEEYAQLLGEQAELVVRAQEGPDQTVVIETARVSSPFLSATVAGTYARDTGAADVSVELVAEPGLANPFEGIDFAGLRFTGDVTGAPGSYAADGDLVLQGFSTPQVAVQTATLEIDVAQSGPADSPTTRLSAEGRVTGMRLDQIGPDVIGEAEIRLAAALTGDDLVLEVARIESQPLDLTAAGTADIASGDFDVNFRASAPALAPILEAYGIPGEGRIQARGEATGLAGTVQVTTTAELTDFATDVAAARRLTLQGIVVQTPERITFDLSGDGEALAIAEIGPDVLDRARLSVTGALEGDLLTLETAQLDSPVLDVAAEGQVNTAASTGQLGLTMVAADLRPVAAAYGVDLGGAAEATGTMVLRPDGLSLTVTADATDLTGEVQSERLHVEASVEQTGERTAFDMTADSPALSVELEGQRLSGPVDVAVTGAMEGDALTLQTARVASPILNATVEGQVNVAELTGAITYDVDEAQLAALAPLAGLDATGILRAAGRLDLAEPIERTPPPAGQAPSDTAMPVSTATTAITAEGTAAIENLGVSGMMIGDLAATYDLAMADVPQGALRLELTESVWAPEGPTVLTLDMAGPPAEWVLDVELTAPNHLVAGGEAVVSWQDPISVKADFTATPGPRLPPQYAQLIGDEARLVIEAEEGADGTIRIEQARLSSPVLNADVSGTYALDSGTTDLAVSLDADPALAAPFEGIEFAGLRFRGDVTGAPGALSADGQLVLDGFASEQVSVGSAVLDIDVAQAGPADAPITEIALSGVVSELSAAALGPDPIGDARIGLAASLAGDALTIGTATIDSDLMQLSAEGTANIATAEFDLAYDVAARSLTPLAAALGVEAGGAVTATGRVASREDGLALETDAAFTNLTSPYADAARLAIAGTVSVDGDRTAFDLTGAGEGLRIDQLGPTVIGDARFTAKGVLDGQELALDTLRVTSPVIDATASGTVNLESGAGRLDYDVSDVALGALGPAFDLPLRGTGRASGVLGLAGPGAGGPRLVGEAAVAGLVYAGTTVGDAALAHDVVLSETPNGTLDLRLTGGPYAPARVQTAFRQNGDRLELDGLQASAFGATVTGDLVVNTATMGAEGALRLAATEGPLAPAEATVRLRTQGDRLVLEGLRAQALGLSAAGDITIDLNTLTADGTLRLDQADLTALGRAVGVPVAGTADGVVRLSAEGGRQVATVDLGVAGLSMTGLAIGDARVQGRVNDALGTPSLDLSVAAQRVLGEGFSFETMTLSARGPLSGVEILLDARGTSGREPLVITAAARADLAGASQRVTVSDLQATLGEDRIALLSPLTVTMQGATIRAADIAVALPEGGRLTGEVAYHGGPVSGSVVLDAPDLSFVERLFDAPVEGGALRLTATFDTRRGSAMADVTLSGDGIVLQDLSGAGVLDIAATLGWNGTILDVDARVSGDFEQPLVVSASVPVRPSGGLLPVLAERGPISARVDWIGEIGDVWALVPAPGHVLTGEVRIDIGVSGDISAPVFTGGILLADGVYQNLDFGTILTGISLATEIQSGGALGLRLDAVDGSRGNVTVEGTIAFDERGINLAVETREAIVVRRDDAIARVDADMRIAQQPDGQLVIEGDVEVLEAEIRLLLDNPPEIVTLGEVRIKGQPIIAGDAGAALPVALRIDVRAPGEIYVRGRGLDSEWRTDLQVRGDVSQPRITGEVTAIRGEFDLLGREFDLERGRVLFNGGPDIDPRLDVALIRTTEDISGGIVISGTASDPELNFTSTPALPEDEVLPVLLFGTSSQALTPAQGIQLALGLATLLNGGGGTLDQVRSALGLDALGIEQDDEGAVLEVGKNVSENVWVGTRQSLEGGGTTIAVEVEILDTLDAYGEVETDGETTVGVQWKKDF